MNDKERILTGGGMVFKKKGKDENAGERKIKFSDFLRGTHKSGAAKMRAEIKYKKALRNTKIGCCQDELSSSIKKHCVTLKRKNNCQLSIVNYQLFRTFACELMWIDLYCLQPQEKMLKTSPFYCRPAKQISPVNPFI